MCNKTTNANRKMDSRIFVDMEISICIGELVGFILNLNVKNTYYTP